MEGNSENNVGETIKIFNLQVGQQMLPTGSNPLGRGNLMRNSDRGLSMEDVPRLIIGHVQEPAFKVEHGTETAFEKIARHGTGFKRDDDESLPDE